MFKYFNFNLTLKRSFYDSFFFIIKIFYQKLFFGFRYKLYYRPRRSQLLFKYVLKQYPKLNVNYTEYDLGFGFLFKTDIVVLEVDDYFKWDISSDEISNDVEKFYSLHRWYWLLNLISESDHILGLLLIKHWIYCNSYNSNKTQWDIYTSSERVHSLASFLTLRMGPEEVRNYIVNEFYLNAFLRQSILHITNNLEYFQGKYTFNHVINNLKGLAIASLLINDNVLTEKSLNLLLDEFREILDTNGFSREGSSHYQFIITRWVFEIVYLINYFNFQFSKIALLIELQYKLWNTVNFFIIDNKVSQYFPLIGDICPDFSPNWLVENFYNKNLSFYKSKLNNYDSLNKLNKNINRIYENYSRFEFYNWIIIIRHPINKDSFFLSHSHSDFLSYCVFYKGYELVIDPGRKDYTKPFYNDLYFDTSYHNTTSINNIPIVLNEQFYYSLPSMKKSKFTINYSDNGALTIRIEIKSIPTNPNISLLKEFSFTDCSFSCNEFYISHNLAEVKLVSGINFPNALQLSPCSSSIKLYLNNNVQKFLFTTLNKIPINLLSINASKSYGDEVMISRIEMRSDFNKDFKLGYHITLI